MPRIMAVGTNRNEGALFIGGACSPLLFNAVTYDPILAFKFGLPAPGAIKLDPRYDPRWQSEPPTDRSFENRQSKAFSHVVNDCVFVCGNAASLERAKDKGASMPDSGNVCHGNERPHVFARAGTGAQWKEDFVRATISPLRRGRTANPLPEMLAISGEYRIFRT